MGNIEDTVKVMVQIANDDSHGYSQVRRWGPDYDCSSLVITALAESGFPVKSYGATFTGNLESALQKCGFTDVTSEVNLKTGSGIIRGDICLTPYSHVEMCAGAGTLVGAHIDECGKTVGAKTGDQTGKEICVGSYYNYPWKKVYRYIDKSNHSLSNEEVAKMCIAGKLGNGDERARMVASMGYDYALIRSMVNKMLNASSASTDTKDITAVAKRVIRGEYGNGNERKQKLEAEGYDYETVRKEVNRLLS